MSQSVLVERITRSLAYMLRHQPEKFDLELDRFGYAELDEVITNAVEAYADDVRKGRFPAKNEAFHMSSEQRREFEEEK